MDIAIFRLYENRQAIGRLFFAVIERNCRLQIATFTSFDNYLTGKFRIRERRNRLKKPHRRTSGVLGIPIVTIGNLGNRRGDKSAVKPLDIRQVITRRSVGGNIEQGYKVDVIAHLCPQQTVNPHQFD